MVSKHLPNGEERKRACAPRPRAAMTMVECTVALAIIGVLMVVLAQCMVWTLQERQRVSAQQAALELAANILEAARAQPFDKLDNTWADAQTIPSEMEALLPGGKVVVKMEPGQPAPLTRRVTVEVTWQFEPFLPPLSVELTTVLSDRALIKAEAKP